MSVISRSLFATAACLAVIGLPATASATTFTFAGVTYEQNNTPNVLNLIGNGVTINGAVFTSGNANNITQSVGFQAASGTQATGFVGQPGFDPSLSLGRQANAQQGVQQPGGGTCEFACAVNLPAGNNGSTARHGLEVSWTGGRVLTNGAGNDFAIYESATGTTTGSADEAFMVALVLTNGTITNWRYEKADGSQTYTGSGDSATVTLFDLSSFGLDSSALVAKILIANMRTTDKVDGAGEGNVNFAGAGNTPLPRGTGSFGVPGSYDPDPLYVGILGNLTVPSTGNSDVPVPGALPLFATGLAGLGWLAHRRKRKARAA